VLTSRANTTRLRWLPRQRKKAPIRKPLGKHNTFSLLIEGGYFKILARVLTSRANTSCLRYRPRLRKKAPFRKPLGLHDTFWFIDQRWLLQNTCARACMQDKLLPLALASSPAPKGSLSEASWKTLHFLVYWSKVVTSKYLRACLHAGQTPPTCAGVLACAKRLPFGSLLDYTTLFGLLVEGGYFKILAGVFTSRANTSRLRWRPRLRKEAPLRKPLGLHNTFSLLIEGGYFEILAGVLACRANIGCIFTLMDITTVATLPVNFMVTIEIFLVAH